MSPCAQRPTTNKLRNPETGNPASKTRPAPPTAAAAASAAERKRSSRATAVAHGSRDEGNRRRERAKETRPRRVGGADRRPPRQLGVPKEGVVELLPDLLPVVRGDGDGDHLGELVHELWGVRGEEGAGVRLGGRERCCLMSSI